MTSGPLPVAGAAPDARRPALTAGPPASGAAVYSIGISL